jgi:hypothetical protein
MTVAACITVMVRYGPIWPVMAIGALGVALFGYLQVEELREWWRTRRRDDRDLRFAQKGRRHYA